MRSCRAAPMGAAANDNSAHHAHWGNRCNVPRLAGAGRIQAYTMDPLSDARKVLHMANVEVRRGMPSTQLTKEEFAGRVRRRFYDPTFDVLSAEIEKISHAAWDGYEHSRKSPRTRPAGSEFADPAYELSVEWLNTRDEIRKAARAHNDSRSPSRVLIVNGSSRSDQTCPGEMSKTYRFATLARELVAAETGFEADFLDLSRLTSEYGRTIHPCKACVSTAMPLCHWPVPATPITRWARSTTGWRSFIPAGSRRTA